MFGEAEDAGRRLDCPVEEVAKFYTRCRHDARRGTKSSMLNGSSGHVASLVVFGVRQNRNSGCAQGRI